MTLKINSVAIVGAGTMGQGIAQVFACAGFKTILYDNREGLVETAIEKIFRELKLPKEKGKIMELEISQMYSRIIPVRELKLVKADLVIEAVVEDIQTKKKLLFQLENLNSPDSILATNTSSLSVEEIFSALRNKSRCVGIHFFNPAPLMKLVEVIPTTDTSNQVTAEITGLIGALGKVPVQAKDSPGFIVNRVARPYYLESLKILEQEIASVGDIDKLMRSSGFKMGPFELMDLIGIDVNLAVTKAVYNGFRQDPKYEPSPLQQEKVLLGQLGRKSGKGFYNYEKF